MKKICFLIWCLLIFKYGQTANTSYTIHSPRPWPHIKLSHCTNISFAEVERLTGHKLNLFQRMAFSMVKNKMKKALRKHPDMTLDQFMRARRDSEAVGTGVLIFAIIGLVLVIMLLVFHRSYDP